MKLIKLAAFVLFVHGSPIACSKAQAANFDPTIARDSMTVVNVVDVASHTPTAIDSAARRLSGRFSITLENESNLGNSNARCGFDNTISTITPRGFLLKKNEPREFRVLDNINFWCMFEGLSTGTVTAIQSRSN